MTDHAELGAAIRSALSEVAFPAARWQLAIEADDRGADHSTRLALDRLPTGTYESVDAVIRTVAEHRVEWAPAALPRTTVTPTTRRPVPDERGGHGGV